MKDLTTKPILKTLLTLAIPIIVGNFLQTVYQFTDLFWIGRHGTDWVAAVSLAGPVIFFFISLGIGFTIAWTILVSQYRGNKNYEALNHVVGQSLVLAFIFSWVLSILGLLFGSQIITLMGADPIVTQQAIAYLKISFIGMIFIFPFMSIQWIFRGIGEVKKPMFIILGTVLLNFIADPILILGYKRIPAYGVQWAAMATICTQSLALVAILILLYRKGKYGIYLKRTYFVLKKKLIKKVLALWIPSGIEMSARSLGMVVLSYIVAGFGTTVIAAYWVGSQIFSIFIFVSVGLSMATTTLIGQFMGAENMKKVDETSKKAFWLAFIPLTLLGVAIFFLAEPLISLFVPHDPLVVAKGVLFLRIISMSFGFFALQQVFSWIFRGAWVTKLPMVLTVVSLWCIQIPVAYFGSMYRGEIAIWVSVPISVILIVLVTLIWYFKWDWKNKRVVHKDDVYG